MIWGLTVYVTCSQYMMSAPCHRASNGRASAVVLRQVYAVKETQSRGVMHWHPVVNYVLHYSIIRR